MSVISVKSEERPVNSINQKNDDHLLVLIACLSLLVGAILLLTAVLRDSFPRNDGGMLVVMVKDLITNHYRLPQFTTYNYSQIPYTYPPLSLYFMAILKDLLGISLIEIERWMPLVFSLLCIPATGLLTRSVLKSNIQAALSMLAFALLPTTFDRLIMGGGVARAPGLLFTLLALNWIYLMYDQKSRRHIPLAVLFSALVVLNHPQYTWFVFFSAVLMFLFSHPGRGEIINSLIVIAGASLLSAFWWIRVLDFHGFSPFLAAFGSRSPFSLYAFVAQITFLLFTNERLLDILGVMALIGLVQRIIQRDFLFLAWIAVIILLDRTAPYSLAAVPLAMLIGVSVDSLVFHNPMVTTSYGRKVLFIAFCYLTFYSLYGTYNQLTPIFLENETREAMAWVKDNTPSDSEFLVLSDNDWWVDPYTEWFPTLAERQSVNTVQGFEWMPEQGLSSRIEAYRSLRECLKSADTKCLAEWERTTGQSYTHIFIPRPISTQGVLQESGKDLPLLESLHESPVYQVVLDRAGGIIFEKTR